MNRRNILLLAAGLTTALPSISKTSPMHRRAINPMDSSYAQAHEVTDPSRILFISGQIPVAADGAVPKGDDDHHHRNI